MEKKKKQDKFQIPNEAVERLARHILLEVQKFFESDEGNRNKDIIGTEPCSPCKSEQNTVSSSDYVSIAVVVAVRRILMKTEYSDYVFWVRLAVTSAVRQDA